MTIVRETIAQASSIGRATVIVREIGIVRESATAREIEIVIVTEIATDGASRIVGIVSTIDSIETVIAIGIDVPM